MKTERIRVLEDQYYAEGVLMDGKEVGAWKYMVGPLRYAVYYGYEHKLPFRIEVVYPVDLGEKGIFSIRKYNGEVLQIGIKRLYNNFLTTQYTTFSPYGIRRH
jgi:hypothetical protein